MWTLTEAEIVNGKCSLELGISDFNLKCVLKFQQRRPFILPFIGDQHIARR